jgi:hypothetical protein
MDTFIHPYQPHVKTVVIKPLPPPPKVFTLAAVHGINVSDPFGKLIDSTAAIRQGLVQAAALVTASTPGSTAILQLEAGWYGYPLIPVLFRLMMSRHPHDRLSLLGSMAPVKHDWRSLLA